jgi:hypothetical protein
MANPDLRTPDSRMRWYQYRLRSLFILTFVVATACSWLAVAIQNQRRQKVVADAIEKAGWIVRSERTWLGRLLGDDSLVRVTDVDLCGNRGLTTDAELVHLESLNELQWLWLAETQVSDASLVHIRGLAHLQGVNLSNTMVTDVGLVHLRGLSQLKRLALDWDNVTDAGLVHLQWLRDLRDLQLCGTKITDVGLVHLYGLGELRSLDVRGTAVGDDGIHKLQQALPECQVLWDKDRAKVGLSSGQRTENGTENGTGPIK